MKRHVHFFNCFLVVCSFTFSGYSSACDSCAETAIRGGFSNIQTAAQKLLSSSQSLVSAISKLQTTVDQGNTSVEDAVNTLTNDLTSSIETMNSDLTTAIQGSTVAAGLEYTRQNKVLEQLSNSYRESMKSVIGNALKTYVAISDYDTIGAGSKFVYEPQLNALQDMYYNSVKVKENAFKAYMPAVVTASDPGASINDAAGSLVAANLQAAIDRKNELITALKYAKTLTRKEYEYLMLLATFNVSTNNEIATIAKKSTFVKLILDKAPIFRLSSKELDVIYPFTPELRNSEECVTDIVPVGALCTSSYALLNTLEIRVMNTSYLKGISAAKEKGVLTELNRSVTIGNIIKSRTLDMQMSSSVGGLFDETE